jgi:3-isopropylmalate/(R)-2-methylmalate dehydratase small subunit
MQPIQRVTSKTVLLPLDDVDTDQIIPARFLKTTERKGLGKVLFHDWRIGDGPARVLDTVDPTQNRILVAGDNFGCGSSREHAPWALVDWGFSAVVAISFADIFRNNALKNGLIPVQLGRSTHDELVAALTDDPSLELTVDVEALRLVLPRALGVLEFSIDPFARRCLLAGTDELGYLQSFTRQITAFEDARNRGS